MASHPDPHAWPGRQAGVSRALAIINPVSGAQHGDLVAQWLRERAAALGVELVVRETRPDSDPRDLVHDAPDYDRVVASGGDGTLMQVMSGLARHDHARRHTPLALIPAGTGNVLVKALGLPIDLRRACEAAFDAADLMPIDLGVVNGELYFALRASIGYEALVIRDTTRAMKSALGRIAYAIQAGRHALTLQPVRYSLEVDGRHEVRAAHNLWVANSGTLGVMGLALDPRIRIDDGQLDLCALSVDLAAMPEATEAMVRLLQQDDLPEAVINHLPVRERVRIDADPPQPVQADGDFIGHTPCEIGVAPKAVAIVVAT